MFSFTGYYSSWYIFVLPAILFATYAQMKVSSAYKKYSKIPSESGLTGSQVARHILDRNGLNEVRIEQVRGVLTDHYDPRSKVLRLSPEVYSGSSIASVSIASHEVGHAIQHNDGYFPLILRNTIAPIAMFGSNLVWVFIILGFIFSPFFIDLGIALFIAAVLFQIVTLPVEFNASRRALEQLENGIISRDQKNQAESMLRAAALTYVAATLVAISELLRLLIITDDRRR
ncbi:MAG TPA: zinc metallopeptidase [Soehngenia sp.]|nr:zinc metallopeptidase [Soehngenia sp.]HPP31532.1 zinc metallopeptidase [Soehngenia sp.]